MKLLLHTELNDSNTQAQFTWTTVTKATLWYSVSLYANLCVNLVNIHLSILRWLFLTWSGWTEASVSKTVINERWFAWDDFSPYLNPPFIQLMLPEMRKMAAKKSSLYRKLINYTKTKAGGKEGGVGREFAKSSPPSGIVGRWIRGSQRATCEGGDRLVPKTEQTEPKRVSISHLPHSEI